jgi:hypothetical protein
MFRSPACSLVQADDVESGSVSFGGNPVHVMGIAAAFKPMQQQQCRSGAPVVLPMAQADQLSIRGDTKKAPFNRDSR